MLVDLKLKREYDGFLFLAEAWRNPPSLQSHHHVELEANLVVRGEITYVVGGRRFCFGRRTLLWMFPSQEHQLVDRSPDAQYYVAVFKPTLIRRSCRGEAYQGLKQHKLESDGVLNTVLEPQSYDLVQKTMDSLMQGALDPDVLNRESGFGARSSFQFTHSDPVGLNAGLHHLLLLCWRCRLSGKALGQPLALHPAVCKAIRLLSSLEDEYSLATLARRCNVSASYLSRVFALQVGLPLTRYRNLVRLERFREIYSGQTSKTITEAMFSAGFGSYAQFYKVFAEEYGRGPRESLRPRSKPSSL